MGKIRQNLYQASHFRSIEFPFAYHKKMVAKNVASPIIVMSLPYFQFEMKIQTVLSSGKFYSPQLLHSNTIIEGINKKPVTTVSDFDDLTQERTFF